MGIDDFIALLMIIPASIVIVGIYHLMMDDLDE